MRIPRPQGIRTRIVVAVALVVVGAGAIAVTRSITEPPAPVTEDVAVTMPAGPSESDQVKIDARLYLPQHTPAPAVLLAHGFGGSKDSVAAQAGALAEDGFVVLAYSARGFGQSTGQISLNDPDREVADARGLVDWLAARGEVERDSPGDPRIGVAGGSYGGALALMLGGLDSRIDAIAAAITWNDLGHALFPNFGTDESLPPSTPAAAGYGGPGVLKRGWAGIFFGAGAGAAPSEAGADASEPRPEPGPCGRFALEFCREYAAAAVSGKPSQELLDLLRAHSPAAVAGAITAPTLLIQGEQDTLFGLDQSDATARQITAAGTPVQVRWFPGGHDAGGEGTRFSESATSRFLSEQLRGSGEVDEEFVFSLPGTPTDQGRPSYRRMTAAGYPGLSADAPPTPTIDLPLAGPASQSILRPPGAAPAALSAVPGLGSALSSLGAVGGPAAGLVADPPGQSAAFATAPLDHPLTITGVSTTRLTVTAASAPGDAVLFAKLYDVSPDGRRTLPGGAVSAIRLPDGPGPHPIAVALPGIAFQVPQGHHLEVVVTTTDQAYANPLSPAQFSVALADDAGLLVPSVPAASSSRSLPIGPLIGIACILGGAAVLVTIGVIRRRRRVAAEVDPALVDTPLVITDLHKTYDNGFRAVDGVSFTVRRGQVLGLLGPNGAGKTTTLRMLMGLITPTEGEIRVFGHRVTPGAPVLSRLGSFVEGSGLLPHLSGIDNLRLYWEATGRPAGEARMDEALEIADLGDAIERKVRSYSQGMRQRLAIAQAMLGLPDLMVLDEPTNGLDPPQIRTMREVLINYARTGRTVLVSSHLLAEVEQTCTDVVVMNHGRVISSGTVEELTSAEGATELRVDDPARAAVVLESVDGLGPVRLIEGENPRLRVDLGETDPAALVRTLVGAGIGVRGLSKTTRLEDVFLRLVDISDHREHDREDA
ncbi:alpha/beta fold hydrolase [Rhodococcus oryzae]|uniref:Alpha/beta fold hydrolase n=1 Tax=Rhodococcus oryzae TaxID=2571143 RepID=A0ABY2RER3_9NOCA|nr:alpha/beta fold hydrolase [Rhodococcus oryzae]TJZ74888.1 alpha/beta fold hydrolase [Rhodococcus oryzae]